MPSNSPSAGPDAAAESLHLLKEAKAPKGCFSTALKIVLWLFVSVVALIVIAYIGLVVLGNSRLKAAQDEARKAGLPFTYTELEIQVWGGDGKVPDIENAALPYQKAFALLPKKLEGSLSSTLPVIGEAEAPEDPRLPLSDGMLKVMSDFISSHKQAIDFLHEGAALPKCQFPVKWDGFYTPMPHLSFARQSARLLALDVWLDTEEGRPADAVSDIKDGLALSRSVIVEPTLISGLVAIAVENITLASADRLFARTDVPPEDLVALQKACEATAASFSLRNSYLGEFVNNQDVYQRLLDGRLSLEKFSNMPTEGPAAPVAVEHLLVAGALRGYFKADQANSARVITILVKNASNPTPAVLGDAYREKLTADIEHSNYILSRMLLPALTKAPMQCENARARLRAAAACIAALRYKNDNASWPDSLETLVPKYIDAVPGDPYNGAPLIYKTSENGVVVYSVGPDCVDEGARKLSEIRPKGTDRNKWQLSDDDIGFRIWKARKPPENAPE